VKVTGSDNAVAYYGTELISATKRFMIQALGLQETSVQSYKDFMIVTYIIGSL